MNLKGGTAKTTTAVSLGSWLARMGIPVLLVDLDPQGSLTKWLGIASTGATELMRSGNAGVSESVEVFIQQTSYENLAAVGADRSLAAVEDFRASGLARKLEGLLSRVEGEYAYCLIDPPPSASSLVLAALMTSHGVLSPVAASKSALDGLSDTMQLMRQVGGAQLRGAFACRVDLRTTSDQQVAPLLTDRLGSVTDGGKAFSSFIRETVKVREAETAQVPPPFYDASMTAATDYRTITEELLKMDSYEGKR